MKKNSMIVDRKRTREVVVVAAVIKIPGIVWRSKDGKEIENGGNGKGSCNSIMAHESIHDMYNAQELNRQKDTSQEKNPRSSNH